MALAISNILPTSPRHEYRAQLAGCNIFWHVKPGTVVTRTDSICRVFKADYPSPSIDVNLKLGFRALIVDLLVTEGAVIPESEMAIMSYVGFPKPVEDELDLTEPNNERVPARLNSLARTFHQIRAQASQEPIATTDGS